MQPSFEITFHSVDLSAHGKNPKGLPIYRVVWADSRKTKLLYKGKIHIIPRYIPDAELNTGAHWILERWKSAQEFVGMSREQYDAMVAQFPWAPTEDFPADGEYDFEYGFEGEVDEVLLNKALTQQEYRRNNITLAEKKAEAVAAEELKEKQQDEIFEQKYEQAREESLTK